MDAETQALLVALRRKLEDAPCSLTFRELWDRYFEASAPTLKDAAQVAALMRAPLEALGDVSIGDFKRATWIKYRSDRTAQTTRQGGPPSVGTRNLELQRAKRVFHWAIEEGLIEASPLASVKRETPRPARETVIVEDGLARFCAVAAPLDVALLLLGIDCGLRRIEARALRWSDVDGADRIRVSWLVSKTRRSRAVMLSSRVREALALLPRVSEWIFANPSSGRPYSKAQLWNRFRAACDLAGLPAADGDGNVHFHDSRHTFVTRTIENGTPPAVAMRAAGHTTFAQASRYFHLTDGALTALAERNEAAIAALSTEKRRGPRRAPPASRRVAMNSPTGSQ